MHNTSSLGSTIPADLLLICRVLFVLDREDETQVGLTPEEKQQLQGISLEQLLSAIRADSTKFSQGNCAYRGVHHCKSGQRFQAQIRSEGKTRYLGYFATDEDAAHAYDKAAQQIHGRYRFVRGSCCCTALQFV